MNHVNLKISVILSIVIVALTAYIAGCINQSSESSARVAKASLMITDDKIILHADSSTLNRFDYIQYLNHHDKELLFFLNRVKNEILIYDAKKENPIHRIRVPVEGPDGAGTIQGFKVYSPDSILITSRQISKIFLIDGKGKILQSYNYRTSIDGELIYPVRLGMDPYKELDLVGGKFYLPGMVEGNWLQISERDFVNTRICIELDTMSKKVSKLSWGYPSDYWQNGRKEPVFGRIFDGQHFIYSFWGDEYIYVTADHLGYSKHYAGTSYLKNIQNLPKEQTMQDYMKYIAGSGRYSTILFDLHRKVYYRWVYLPEEEKLISQDLMKSARFPSKTVIVILDSDFNWIGETKLPDERFYAANFFINKKGLYLSECHPNNDRVGEDSIIFTRLDLRYF
ncbi:MAG: DUF4221 domain-containing protein [Cyclobacteriaceae bacterium]|nr:DUF4221 domain-containing protein [Cyclobacteriaceae bacterium]